MGLAGKATDSIRDLFELWVISGSAFFANFAKVPSKVTFGHLLAVASVTVSALLNSSLIFSIESSSPIVIGGGCFCTFLAACGGDDRLAMLESLRAVCCCSKSGSNLNDIWRGDRNEYCLLLARSGDEGFILPSWVSGLDSSAADSLLKDGRPVPAVAVYAPDRSLRLTFNALFCCWGVDGADGIIFESPN